MSNLHSTAEHRQHRLVLVLLGLFTSCDALVINDEAAEASGSILTPERSAQAATLPRPAPGGEADTDGFRETGVIGLASGLDEDRRRDMALVNKRRCRPFDAIGASPRTEVPQNEEICDDGTSRTTSYPECRHHRTPRIDDVSAPVWPVPCPVRPRMRLTIWGGPEFPEILSEIC